MQTSALAHSSDWNKYWSLDQTKRFTKISWSKRRIIRLLTPYLIKGHHALDAGCGSGFFSRVFCDAKMNVVSLDYSNEALTITKELTNSRSVLLQADLLTQNLSTVLSQKADLIFTDGLFEHFDSATQDKIMNNLKGVLSQNGVIFTFVPNRFSPWEIIRPLYMPGIKEDPFTLKQLVHLNTRNGLKVLAKGGINTFPFSFSPDNLLGSFFGMLLYTISIKS